VGLADYFSANLFPLLFRKEAGQENRELDENLDKIWRYCR